MKIYEPKKARQGSGDYAYCRLTFQNDEDRKRFNLDGNFRGVALRDDASAPYPVKRSTDYPQEIGLPVADRLGIGLHIDPMALSRRALDVLLPHIGPLVQVVPLVFNEGDYALLNVINVIDALDAEQSDIAYFKSGNFDRIKRYAFLPQAVRDQWIFKIKQTQSRAFVTDKFVDLVTQTGLTGFDFEPVWSDEPVVQGAED